MSADELAFDEVLEMRYRGIEFGKNSQGIHPDFPACGKWKATDPT